jgi:hypothetical protein
MGCPIAYIDLRIFKSLLQILVYGFIRDLTDQSKIRNPNFFLLCGIECSFLDIWFAAAGLPAASSRLCIVRRFISLRTPADTLDEGYIVSTIYKSTFVHILKASYHLRCAALPSRLFYDAL